MSSPTAHDIAAYQAMRAFMAMKTPAITSSAATLALLLCLANEITANWEAMTRASPKFATARRCISVCFPVGPARDRFPKMVLDFLPHAARQRPIEIEFARQPFEIVLIMPGSRAAGVPASRPPIASENCFQTARRSANARLPDLVSV